MHAGLSASGGPYCLHENGPGEQLGKSKKRRGAIRIQAEVHHRKGDKNSLKGERNRKKKTGLSEKNFRTERRKKGAREKGQREKGGGTRK